MRAALALLILAATASAASARCPSFPEDAASHYVQNTAELTLCLQRELAQATEHRAMEAQLKAQLDALEAQVRRQQQMLIAIPPPIVALPPPGAAWQF